jgi:hypothetical protein
MKKIHITKQKSDVYGEVGFVAILGFILLIIGIIFLIPPILGVLFFMLSVFGEDGYIASLSYLSGSWTCSNEGGMSAAPIYLGLMAIAGSLIVHSAIKNFVSVLKNIRGIDSISDIEITEEYNKIR